MSSSRLPHLPPIDRPVPGSSTAEADDNDFSSCSPTAEEDDDGDADWSGMEEVADSGVPADVSLESMTSASRRRRSQALDQTHADSLPRHLQRRIERDVAEVRLLPSFCASEVNWDGGLCVSLRVGFPVSSLGMNAEQVGAWSLHNDLLLMAELRFPSHYFNGDPYHIQVTVGTATTTAAPSTASTASPLGQCKLSWILESRIRRQFISGFDCSSVTEPAFSLHSAIDVASICDCDLLTAIRALMAAKQDVSAAVLRIRPEPESTSVSVREPAQHA